MGLLALEKRAQAEEQTSGASTRHRLRRRMPLMRIRAELLAPTQHTHRPYNLPALGTKLAYQANRDGVAQRFAEPAVQQSIAVARALIGPDERRRTDLALSLIKTAQAHKASTISRPRSIPGGGQSLALVLLDEIPASQRFPRGQACVSYCRLVNCTSAGAGARRLGCVRPGRRRRRGGLPGLVVRPGQPSSAPHRLRVPPPERRRRDGRRPQGSGPAQLSGTPRLGWRSSARRAGARAPDHRRLGRMVRPGAGTP
jgi:Transposase IS116/IS110/IS902 family